MPGAIAGDGDEEGYVFVIKATPQQVQEYYLAKLSKRGWQPLAQGEGDLSLTFIDSMSGTLTVTTITEGDEALVLLAK